jgi:dTDP-4-dehydrorhamnose reductase
LKKPWLVTGGSGQLGGAVVRLSRALGDDVFCPTREEMHLSDPSAIRNAMNSKIFKGVLNCAAYTAVDKAESEPDLAFAINATAPKILAQECARLEIPLIHVSTDYVFDGSKKKPYIENDAVGPLCIYGASKEVGENAIRESGAQHAIIRTAWLLNSTGANFFTTMLRLGSERDELRVVSDQYGSPTSAKDLATALILISRRLYGKSGTWHVVNRGDASWYELATYVFRQAGRRGCRVPSLTAIPSSEYPTPAKRPANSILSTDKLESDFGIRPRHWQHAVDSILEEHFI